VCFHSFDFFQSCNSALDCLEVGQHTAKPSLIYIEHTAALSLCLDCILSLFLGTYEQDCSAVCHDISYCIVSIVNHSYRLLQVDDVDTVTLGVNIRSHFRVPSSCLMSEMNTCI